jgi:maltose-binding protein MalE
MELKNKDAGITNDKQEFIGYYNNDSTNYGLYFQYGKLSFIYTDNNSDDIEIKLTVEQTLEMYKYMKRYFEKDLIN